ncbi:adenylate/guanylate cyclase domain-containing protein [Paracraurococcus ruber]|uniref:Guanylate cyclase domain-containing protein n=1 Tax=Paracraurococcus ruber TaxID=77675 RepID=A0ABS1CXW0_9PROT|nr:adenylate/guanylate cyclase domain-containing protein [Paracraurococcus ruber]MBK1659378.1 hypothetical protein [Paracraurococcus ruber]TDG27105.1 adenylate/guanylate cyclase domain-containing protein [Paracraurococcus ruber]
MSALCPSCGQAAVPGQFCDHCGTRLHRPCAGCGTANRPAARFCTGCGNALDGAGDAPRRAAPDLPTALQKHVSVLFADISDSTALISRMETEDASDILAPVLRAIAETVQQHGGIVATRMGDGLMAVFGAPLAAEDHAARACLAALAILENVGALGPAALPVRIGICSGPVILRANGPGATDVGVEGLTAHIANRLEQKAEPSTILIAPQTARLVGGIAILASIGAVALKGIDTPMHAYRLLGVTDATGWTARIGLRPLTRFVGRDEELVQLSQAAARAQRGRLQAMAVVADAGMGKSRLLHEFLAGQAASAWLILRVETTAQSIAVPYLFITALLRQLSADLPEDGRGEPRRDIMPLLSQLDPDAATGPADPAERRQRMVRTVRDILLRLAGRRPVLLILEDYHWLDNSSAELLQEVLDSLDWIRLMVLVTARPERRPDWGDAGHASRTTIRLRDLTAAEGEAILKELLGGSEALAPLRRHIVGRADGTPFFLEEFARSLQESGVLAEGPPAPERVAIPDSVHAIIASRIDRLSPLHRHILQVAAVIGRDVPSPLLAGITDIPPQTIAIEIGVLITAGYLTRTEDAPDPTHRFTHALVRAVAYGSLLRSHRRALHRRVLAALEARRGDRDDTLSEDLAHHATLAEAWPEAARYALEAAERASRRPAWREAKAFLETAILALERHPPGSPAALQAIDVRLRLRSIQYVAADQPDTAPFGEPEEAQDATADPVSLARGYINRCNKLSHGGELARAIQLGRSAVDIMLEHGKVIDVVSASFALGQAYWYAGELESGRTLLEAHLAHADSEEGHARTPATFVLPSVVYFCFLAQFRADLGRAEAGMEAIRKARALSERHGHAFDHLVVSVYEGDLLLQADRVTDAIILLEQSLATARANGIGYHIPSIASVLGRAYVATGRHVEARDLLTAASDQAGREGRIGKRLICGPPLVRALAEGRDGDLALAMDVAGSTLAEATARGFLPTVVHTHLALAHLAMLGGTPGQAGEELAKAEDLARRIGLRRLRPEIRRGLAAIGAASGDATMG